MKNKAISADRVQAFIKKQLFPADSKWPPLLYCIQGHQCNSNLSKLQRTEFIELLITTLKMQNFTDELLNEVFQKKEDIINIPYVAELQAALAETASLLDRFTSMSRRRVSDLVDLEKTALDTVMSGKNPRDMVNELRKAFKAVLEMMEEDSKLLEELSNTDQLTGLANRRSFDAHLDQFIAQASQKTPLTLLLFDIDDFKVFNDNYGHLVGDEVLKIVGKIIQEAVSEANATDNRQYVSARYGGEEFGIIMPLASQEECLHLAEFIRRRIEHYPLVIRNTMGDILAKDIHITASGGFCQLHPKWLADQNAGARLIAAADKALYAAKKRGSNMICQCKPYLDPNKKVVLAIL